MPLVDKRHRARSAALRRVRRKWIVGALLVLVLSVPGSAWSYVESPVLSGAARVQVWCWSDAEWAPYRSRALAFYAPESASVDAGIHLPGRTCARLVRASSGWRPEPGLERRRLGMGLFTLAHEVGHAVRPNGTELDANCVAAATTFWRIAARLGIGSRYSLALARIVASRVTVPCWPASV